MTAAAGNNTAAEQGSGPAQDLRENTALVRSVDKAVDELRNARTYIERDIDRNRQDVRDLGEQVRKDTLDVSGRIRALETKVADLPSKVWIGTALLGTIAVLSGIATIIARATGH